MCGPGWNLGTEILSFRMSSAISNSTGSGLLPLGMDHMILSKSSSGSIETGILSHLTSYSGDYHEYGQILVHEGDSLTTDFELDTDSGEWTDNWILVPGAKGEAAGEESGSGGVSISFRKSFRYHSGFVEIP